MDEEKTGSDLEETPEGETGDPSPEPEDGEGETEETETREETRLKHIRDDLYRRQSSLESKLDQFMAEARESRKPQAQDPSSDPVTVRTRLASDPLGVIDETARRAARDEYQKERLAIERQRAEDTAYDEFPELRDQSHPFYRRVAEEARSLASRGNQGPDLALITAREIARRHPELRDEGMSARRKKVESGSKRIVTTSKVDTGAPRPTKEAPEKISEKEFKTARRYGYDLRKEADRAKYLSQRKYMHEYFDGKLPEESES